MKVADCPVCGGPIEATSGVYDKSGEYEIIVASECGHVEPQIAQLRLEFVVKEEAASK